VQCAAIFTVSHFQFLFYSDLPLDTRTPASACISEAIHGHFRSQMSHLVDQILLEDTVLISVTEV